MDLCPLLWEGTSPPHAEIWTTLPLYTYGSLDNLIVALTPKYGRAGSMPPPTKVSFLQYGPISLLWFRVLMKMETSNLKISGEIRNRHEISWNPSSNRFPGLIFPLTGNSILVTRGVQFPQNFRSQCPHVRAFSHVWLQFLSVQKSADTTADLRTSIYGSCSQVILKYS